MISPNPFDHAVDSNSWTQDSMICSFLKGEYFEESVLMPDWKCAASVGVGAIAGVIWSEVFGVLFEWVLRGKIPVDRCVLIELPPNVSKRRLYIRFINGHRYSCNTEDAGSTKVVPNDNLKNDVICSIIRGQKPTGKILPQGLHCCPKGGHLQGVLCLLQQYQVWPMKKMLTDVADND